MGADINNKDPASFHIKKRFVTIIGITLLLLAIVTFSAVIMSEPVNGQSQTNLTVEIRSWDIIGIDNNKPAEEGPNQSLIQARICNIGASNATNVTVNFN